MNSKLLSIFFLLCLLTPTLAQSSFNISADTLISRNRCAKDIQQVLYQEWKTSRQWQKLVSTKLKEHDFISPSSKFGKWIHLSVESKKIRASLSDANNKLIIDWNNNCDKTISRKEIKRDKKISRMGLNDNDLKKLIDTKENGVIYVWAPEMAYSVEAIKEILAAAKNTGVFVDIFLSPVSDLNFAKKVVKEKNLNPAILKRHVSNELNKRGVDLHYPSIITYKKNLLSRYARPGYEPQITYTDYLKRIFSK